VTGTRDLGTAHLVALDLAGSPLVARVPPGTAPAVGPCGVRFTRDQVHVFRPDGHRVEGARPLAATGKASP
jgi:hypothetical protein